MHLAKSPRSASRLPQWILLTLTVFVGITALLFWPLLSRLGSALYDRSDSLLNTWILGWEAHSLVRNPLDLFAAPIFYPLRNSLAFSEIIWPLAPLAVPLSTASGNPVWVYNLLYLASFVLAGLTMTLLAQRLTRCYPAALLAGLIYAFSSHQMGHLSQIQLLSIGWLPLVVLALERVWLRGRAVDGLWLTCVVTFQALSAFYYAFQVALIVGLYVLLRLAAGAHRARLGRLVVWVGVAGLMIAPFTLPYFTARTSLGLERTLGEAQAFSPPLVDYLLPRLNHPLYGRLLAAIPALREIDAGGLFLGGGATTLAVVGLAASMARQGRRRQGAGLLQRPWFWLALFALAVTLSLGPQLKWTPTSEPGIGLPFGWLFQHIPGFTAIRAPGRFGVSAFLALAVLASFGAAALLGRLRTHTARGVATAALAGVVLLEYAGGLAPFSGKVVPTLTPPPPAIAWLAGQACGAVIELPLTSEMAGAAINPPLKSTPAGRTDSVTDLQQAWPDFNMFRYQYFTLAHWQPSVDGFTGFVPPHHRELGLSMAAFPSPRSLAILQGLGVSCIVVHSQLMENFQPGRAARLRAALTQAQDVVHIQDFGEAWVYRLRPRSSVSPAIDASFWLGPHGEAAVVLQTDGPGTRTFAPDERLTVQATWRPVAGGETTRQTVHMPLPLAVEETSIAPITLQPPQAAGVYTLSLQALTVPFPLPIQQRQVQVDVEAIPSTLLPIQLEAISLQAPTQPDDLWVVQARWRLLDRPTSDISVAGHVLDAKGAKVVNDDQPLSGGRDLVREWTPGLTLTTTHRQPAAAVPPHAGWRLFLYRPDTAARFEFFDPNGHAVSELWVTGDP